MKKQEQSPPQPVAPGKGEIHPKLHHQIERARKLADAIMYPLESNSSEMRDAMPEHWVSLAHIAGITPPSEETQAITLVLLEDREKVLAAAAENAQKLLTKFHASFPPVSQLKERKRARLRSKN